MRLRQVTLHVITDTNAATFETAVNDFLKVQGEGEMLSITFTAADSPQAFTAYILYTK